MNNNFGTLTENKTRIEYAPSSLKIGNIFYSNPSKEQYLQKGYKFIINNYPEHKEGFYIEFDNYTEDEENIYYNYKYSEVIKEEQQKEGFKVSKLYFRIALTKLGLWEQVVEWMKSTKIMLSEDQWINMYEAYCDALVLDTSSELFEPYLERAKDVFKDYVTSEQVDEILLNCKAK